MPDRPYDLVLFGATGFAGALTADHLARHLPPEARWALAGRNPAKLRAVRDQLAEAGAHVELLVADATNADSLREVAESARVVITTVGPYLEHGEPLVAACAAAGTDYVDLTGEPEFVDRMYLAHHATAARTGARIVHACGFDSVPHDLGALFTRKHLPEGAPVTIHGVVRSNAMISGGTFHSALGQFARAGQMRQAMKQRHSIEPRPEGRRARAKSGKPHRDQNLGLWLVPLPTIDPFIVQRSAAARDDYGPNFTYTHYAGVKNPVTIAGAVLGIAALMAAAQVPPLRRLIASRLPRGEGPSPQRRARSWFTVDFVGRAAGRTVRTRISGGDPGYTETAKMLAEAAMCLAYDDNPRTAGQVTTATAMGENLTRRLIDAGISFSVLDPATTEGQR
ncbi:saccharopine dehydrogenase family protein [Saccharopolyspora mangrovi]|uniref:Saccharopine dehydrogenase NADP-binding domain-containing protein n=1 Tax=Saccharopolyspora mangrovi TaxID=3082379 RepID=A0ABU6ADR9_9PSEU|nr:saccharopine dehydrogenase NADP-binding domain-containing protein [Saccharopolyspora sp. S2-29]MEB3369697.1 saccharopine dehydrogenase NADP-binding domain-containing protein [Saccharopolyspora sp. S2-29]